METLLIEHSDAKKLRGGYYTPPAIATFICRWAITRIDQMVLEPSCGDGNFIEAAIQRFLEIGVSQNDLFGLLKGIELIEAEAVKTKRRAAAYGLNSTTIVNSDFFSYLASANGDVRFDVVIGNPPFIRYQNFPEEHRNMAFQMMEALGLSPNKLTNVWVPFLVLSANALRPGGKLGMVIPAELFQVKYAAETRVFLSNFFSRITIVTFKKLVFDDIQQEIVLLLCEKDVEAHQGIRVVELDSLQDLNTLDLSLIHATKVKSLEHNSEKWTKYFLEEAEIQLLRKIKADNRIKPCGAVMEVDVGLVTGRNEFFMVNSDKINEWKLAPYLKKVASKSAHFKGIVFTDKDFEEIADAGKHVYLFLPPDKDFKHLPKACQRYISSGEELEYHTGYKCRIRKRWYITPSLWVPDGFVLRQVGEYPKLILNKTVASSTDTIHRVRFTAKVRPEILALSFFNSLTFAFSEITGRSYGGGVLTFEPTEIEELPLPLLNNHIDIKKIDSLVRKKDIEGAMDIIDQELLIDQLNFSWAEVNTLRNIWKKMNGRRSGRRT